jgi:hypothetical protein
MTLLYNSLPRVLFKAKTYLEMIVMTHPKKIVNLLISILTEDASLKVLYFILSDTNIDVKHDPNESASNHSIGKKSMEKKLYD